MKTVTLLLTGDVPKEGDFGWYEEAGCWMTAEEYFERCHPKPDPVEDSEKYILWKKSRSNQAKLWGCVNGKYNGSRPFIRF